MNELLEVKDLHVSYGNNKVLQGLNFSAGQGMTVILGQNGCGKTTLFRTILGAVKQEKGDIYCNNQDLSDCTVKKRAQLISCMSQRENQSPGLRVIDITEMAFYPAKGMFFRAGNAEIEKINKYAEKLGIESLLYRPVNEISAGQAQLAQLLASLIQDTPVLLADEPVSTLDYNNTHHVMRLLRELGSTKTVVVILHDPTLALQYADRVLVMNNGRLDIEICPDKETPEEIELKLNAVYPGIRVISNGGEIFCK